MGCFLTIEDDLEPSAVLGLENACIVGKYLVIAGDLFIRIVKMEPQIQDQVMIDSGFI